MHAYARVRAYACIYTYVCTVTYMYVCAHVYTRVQLEGCAGLRSWPKLARARCTGQLYIDIDLDLHTCVYIVPYLRIVFRCGVWRAPVKD